MINAWLFSSHPPTLVLVLFFILTPKITVGLDISRALKLMGKQRFVINFCWKVLSLIISNKCSHYSSWILKSNTKRGELRVRVDIVCDTISSWPGMPSVVTWSHRSANLCWAAAAAGPLTCGSHSGSGGRGGGLLAPGHVIRLVHLPHLSHSDAQLNRKSSLGWWWGWGGWQRLTSYSLGTHIT